VALIYSWFLFAQKDIEGRVFEKQRLNDDARGVIDSYYLKTDVDKLLTIHSVRKVEESRELLIEFLWEQNRLIKSIPTAIQNDHKDVRYEGIDNLSRIDLISIDMEYGLVSKAYHFLPEVENGKIIIYHQGHGGDFVNGKAIIEEFISEGYAVVGFSMPLLGMNNQPDVYLDRFGWFHLERHEEMSLLAPRYGHPLKYFIEPVIQLINYLEQQYDYSVIAMVGLSGGGWTTTLVAAIDTRVTASFPVAGSMPMYLRSRDETDWGEWEENVPELLRITSYLDLYVLGSVGAGRKQLQILNLYDPCCYTGAKAQTYGNKVSSLVEKIGVGEFELYIDDSHQEHKISRNAVNLIDETIRSVTDSSQK
jgi:hypothetical protein